MSFRPLNKVTSRTMVLPPSNIDTDQIMPAKFLSMTTKAGLGEHVLQICAMTTTASSQTTP